MLLLHLSFKALHLLVQGTEEEKQPRLPVWRIRSEAHLCLSQGEIIALFAVLYDAFQSTVGRIDIPTPKQQKCGQNAGEPAVAVLKGMNGQEAYGKHADNEQGVKLPCVKRGICPLHKLLHEPGRVKGRGGFKDNAYLLPVSIESGHTVRSMFILTPMALVFVAVAEQVPVKLADMIFCQSNMLPRLKNLFHGFRVPGHFLLIARGKGMDGEPRQQSFHLAVRKFAALNTRGGSPTLSMVATRRRAVSRSGARVPNAFHAPLNSSIWAMSRSISGVMFKVSKVIIPKTSSKNTHFVKPQIHPISSETRKSLRYSDLSQRPSQ